MRNGRLQFGWPMTVAIAAFALLALTVSPAAWGQGADHAENQPLRVAADVGFAPFAIKNASGKVEGFSVDVAAELAKRLGRPGFEIVDVNWSAIFSGLFAKRYEFNIAPTNITQERASKMLFTEGYMDTGLGFLMLKENLELKSPEELKGKIVSVNNGSVSDSWLTKNQSHFGYEIQRYDKQPDAVQAVMTRRADVNVADLPNSQYVAKQQPKLKLGLVVYTGNSFGFPFRKEDVAFRNRIERLVEGMKLDGSLAKLHEKWFGSAPGPDTSMSKVWVGYGAVGFEGYTDEPHKPDFK